MAAKTGQALAIAALIACVWRAAGHGPEAALWPAIAALVANIILCRRPGETAAGRDALPARSDAATGLLTRTAFVEGGGGQLREARRRDRLATLLLVTVEGGEAALPAAADAVRRALPAGALSGRIDDATIAALVVTDPRHAHTVDALADYLLGALAQPLALRGVMVRVQAAVALADADAGASIARLIEQARAALAAGRGAGRHRPARYDDALARTLADRTAAAARLRDAIAAGGVVPGYTPLPDDAAGFAVRASIAGVADAVADAETAGLAAELTAAAMRRALADARDWDAGTRLSFTLTMAEARDPWLAQKIVKLLVETGFPAHRLEIALPQAASVGETARATLGSLANQGVRLALTGVGGIDSPLALFAEVGIGRIELSPALAVRPAAAAAIVALGTAIGMPVSRPPEDEAVPIGVMRRRLAERGLLPAARVLPAAEPLRRTG